MSSSDKKGFTGTAIVLLGLFGVGGAVLDRMRNADDKTEKAPVAAVREEIVAGAMTDTMSGPMSKAPVIAGRSEQARQKPDFEAIKLARDGTGRVIGKAAPGANIIVEIDGESKKMVAVDANGDFSVDLNKPLSVGTHILGLKSIGPVGREPVGSDRSIKIDVANGHDITVFVLEKGQDPLILQGSNSNTDRGVSAAAQKAAADKAAAKKLATAQKAAADKAAAKKLATAQKVAADKAAAKKLATAQKAAADKAAAKKLATAQKAAADKAAAKKLATAQKAAADKAAAKKLVAAKMEAGKKASVKAWRDISFADMGYQDKNGKFGEVNLTGKAQSGAKLRFLLDGKAIGSAIADKNGVWSLKAKRQLEPGAHWLVAEQVDGRGKRIAVAEAPFDRPDKVIQMASNETGGRALESGKAVVADGGTPSEKRVAQAGPAGGDQGGVVADKKAGMAGAKTGAAGNDKSLWDKFKGIFKVDPNAPANGNSSGTGLAGNKKSAGDKLAKKDSGSKSFAFESLAYHEGARGGTVMMTGRSKPDAHIKLFEDKKVLGETVADGKGRWAFNKKGKVKRGTHLFRAVHILKTGREGAVAHMQYDHVTGMRVARNTAKKIVGGQASSAKKRNSRKHRPAVKSRVANTPAREGRVGAGTQKTDVRSAQVGKSRKARKARRLARKLKRARRARAARKYARSKRASRRLRGKRKYYATGRRVKSRLRAKQARRASLRPRKARKVRRVRKTRLASKKSGVRRRYLGGNIKARYWIKKKPYLKNGKLRKRVRVYKGNKFYGYGRIRSRNGKVVVLIRKKK